MKEPTFEREHPMGYGVQRFYVFFNGFGASVVRYMVTDELEGSPGAAQGLWDLSVLEIDYPVVPGELPFRWTLCYYTDITSDTIGHLDDDEVDEILERIELLPSRSKDVIAL